MLSIRVFVVVVTLVGVVMVGYSEFEYIKSTKSQNMCYSEGMAAIEFAAHGLQANINIGLIDF